MRKKKTFAAGLAAVLALSNVTASFAGVWLTGEGANAGRYWYRNSDGSYPANTWSWIDGNNDGTAECYYFDAEGWLAVNTTLYGNYQVNADGAWVQGGVVQTKSADQIPAENRGSGTAGTSGAANTETGQAQEAQEKADSRGDRWVADGSNWKYKEGSGFATETWVKTDGNSYYFDEQSHMVTGFAMIDGANYYFQADGALQKKTFQMDGVWYVVDEEDYSVLDEVEEEDWASYRSENAVSNIDWSTVGKTEYGRYILDENTDRNIYLTTNGVNDMKIVCAVLGANGVAETDLNAKEKKVYEVARNFAKKKSIREADDYEKVLEIIKYIWKKASYEKKGDDCYTPYGALVKGKTVCEGYARSFKLLCNCVGISCYFMDATYYSTGHAWNGVLIDGEWYLVDTTETKSGLDADWAEAMLFNTEMVDRGFRIHLGGTTVFPNISYYRECDWSEYPDMDGTSYIEESYFVYTDD